MRKDVVVAIIVTFCLTVAMFRVLPIAGSPGPRDYDPWYDVNDDGTIDVKDIYKLSMKYGTSGTPITKAGLLYDSGWINISDKQGQYVTITPNIGDLVTLTWMPRITGKSEAGASGNNIYWYGYDMPGWNQTYGGTGSDSASSVVQTGDGGYALAGYTQSFGAGNLDFWLVKTDAGGNMQWNKTYGGTNADEAFSVVQTGDGGYALAGVTGSFGAGNWDCYLVKTDASGNMQWNKTYGGTNIDYARSVVQTADGGYAIAGYTQSFGAGGYDAWLVKTDANGNAQWNKTYGGTSNDFADSVVQTGDGGYALAGDTWSFGAGRSDFWLVKTDAGGNMQWNKTYGGTNEEEASSVVQTRDGGYILAGYTYSFGAGIDDAWLVKADANGNEQWNKTYGGTGTEWALSVVQTGDGGYALAGYTNSSGAGNYDAWLVKVDANGNEQWNKTYGGTNFDSASSVVQTSDGGYALAGGTLSFGAGGADAWLVKTDAFGLTELQWGITIVGSTADTITLYRGTIDPYYNYVRLRLYIVK